MDYHQRASDLGHPAAMTYLADSLLRQADEANFAAAIAFDFPDALYRRAKIYTNDQPEYQDYLKAAKLYRRWVVFSHKYFLALL